LEIRLPQGSMSLSPAVMLNAAGQAGTGNVLLTLQAVNPSSLTAAQQAAIKAGDSVFSITLAVAGQSISALGGALTVSIPYTGVLPPAIWHLDAAGSLRLLDCVYDPARALISFTTSQLSHFVAGQLDDGATRVRLTVGLTSYTVNNMLRAMDAAPEIVSDRTFVPLRFIAEALGARVDWNDESRTAQVMLGGAALEVVIGEIAPGMDVPAMILNDRTMVPLRYISEALGAEVVWDPDAHTISITR